MFIVLIGASLLTVSQCDSMGISRLVCSEMATPAGRAIIVQSGPIGGKPVVRKEIGPGYSILEQESGGNRAIVIQSGPGSE
jgi:hypothetical protein